MWRNAPDRWGRVSRLIHWAMALGIIGMLALGLWMTRMEPGMAMVGLYGWHKSVGILMLALVLLRLLWHRISPPPGPLGPAWAVPWAQVGHRALYALMLALPLLGWVGSSATGTGVALFGPLTLPPITPASEAVETVAFALHRWGGWLLLGLVVGHVIAALWHAAVGDRTLARMWRG